MQDLGAVNEAGIPFHPLVSNPYTLLAQVPWRDPDTLEATQYIWTVFP